MLQSIYIKTSAEIDIIDITPRLKSFVRDNKLESGALLIHIKGSTASVSTIEYEPGLIYDIKKALTKLFPPDAYYKHHETWNDGNGYSHIMATVMKPSIIVPLEKSELILGTWQQIILMDFDNKPRNREIILKFLR